MSLVHRLPSDTIVDGTIQAVNLTGQNTGDQIITLDGAVQGSGTGAFKTTLTSNGVTEDHLSTTIAGESQTLTGPGDIDLTTRYTEVTATGFDDALNMAEGTINGQVKIVSLQNSGGTAVLTPNKLLHYTAVRFEEALGSAEFSWSVERDTWILQRLTGAAVPIN